jgi:hypothetical protein
MSATTELKIWPELRPYVVIEKYVRDGGSAKNARHRIELRALPWELRSRALAVTMPCVSCGGTIHPFRDRRSPAKRGRANGHVYFACCCPLETNISCSRGGEARDEYVRVAEDIADAKRMALF